jgi:hypothetical protein
MSNALTFRPSVLVGASITRKGNVTYAREDLGTEMPGGSEVKRWTTTKVTERVEEYKRSHAVVSECRRLLESVCVRTAVGLICPLEDEPRLETVFQTIQARLSEANAEFELAHLACWFAKGYIRTDDQESARAIAAEIAAFVRELTQALEACDVKKIRATLASARGVERVLEGSQSETLAQAIQTARHAANTIAREVERKGRRIEEVRRELDLSAVDVARFLFVEPEPEEELVPAAAPDLEARARMDAVEPEDDEARAGPVLAGHAV